MSNKINQSTLPKDENKNDNSQNHEKDNRFLQDLQLLSSIKSIPGKIIQLNNKINEVAKNNIKESSNDKNNNKIETTNKMHYKSKSIFMPMDKPIINNFNNNINNVNNTYTTNNFFFNNGVNNTNINISVNPMFNQPYGMGIVQDQFGYMDSSILYTPPSDRPSLLSFKSDMKNNILQTENKFTQNSFYLQNMIFNGNYNNQNDMLLNKNNNMNNIINNKFSQLSFHQHNLGKEVFLKKKRSSNLLLRKDSDNNLENNVNYIYNNNINTDKKNTSLIFNKNEENSKKENKNIINIKEEKELYENNNLINKNKKIIFNIENYSEESYEDEEDDNIYHSIPNKSEKNTNIFNCFHKKKKRRKKIHEIKKFKCFHPTCDYSYKTLKQLQNHHYKMTSECQLDSVQVLKLIYNTKLILLDLINKNKNKKEYFSKIYEDSVNNINLNNYSESITGIHIDDII